MFLKTCTKEVCCQQLARMCFSQWNMYIIISSNLYYSYLVGTYVPKQFGLYLTLAMKHIWVRPGLTPFFQWEIRTLKWRYFFASKAIELRDEWWNLGLTYGYMVGTSNLGTHHDGTTHQDLWDDYEEKGVFHTDYQTWQSNMACWKIPGSGFFLLFSCPFRSVISRCPGEYFQPYPYPLANKGRI